MSGAREQILSRVREALHSARGEALDTLAQIDLDASNPRPALKGDLVTMFTAQLEAMAATWEPLVSRSAVPGAVDAYLQGQQLAPAIVMTGDAALRGLEWPGGIAVAHRAAQAEDRVSVTSALAGVAETGTLLLASSAQMPTTLNFLPEHHLVVLDAGAIVPYLEDLWPIVRALPDGLPRTLNLITGPSRTADVEQTIQLGAHGPRRLHLLLIAPP
jgi:L-lactate dehydrogenase complex protein LldG